MDPIDTSTAIAARQRAEASAEERRLRLVIEAAPNAMVMVDRHGTIILVNTQTERLFGYSRAELLGQTVEMLVPQRFRANHAGYRDSFFAHPDARSMGAGRDLHGLRKDGGEVPIEIGLNPLQMPEGDCVLASIIDITERLNADKLFRAAQADRLRQSILDSLPFSTIATDVDGLILSANPAAARLLGYERRELVGHPILMLHDAGELERRAIELSQQGGGVMPPDFQAIVASGSLGTVDEREWTYLCKGGARLPVNIAITTLRDDAGKVNGFLAVAYDITARMRAEASIRHMAHHDALTGLPNRVLLLDRLEMAIHLAERHKTKLAVLMIDLDHFKRVNDSLGHQIGDLLLLTISKRLLGSVREVDTVARLGGDEFVVLLTEVSSRESLVPVIGGLTKAIATAMSLEGHELAVTASIGGCMFAQDGSDASTLLKNADTAMYHAKTAGRSNFQWFTNAMLLRTEEKLALGTALRRAIENNELAIHYQPKISLAGRCVIGMEALVRWNSAKLGAVSPDRFVPIAEETGLILELGEWVLRTACRECAGIKRTSGRDLVLAVNVSPRQLQQKDWTRILQDALRGSGIDPASLELEITEGMLMQNPEECIEMLGAIRKLGVAVVVDDFGTGYSSLSYITRFPIDKIKIDRSFVRDLATDAADAAIINAIIAMAHSLGIRVIAEGVETEQQHHYVLERGCDEAQGFLYSQAVPADRVGALIPMIERQPWAH